jgi:hypothetical protein
VTMAAPCLGGDEYMARAVCTGINTEKPQQSVATLGQVNTALPPPLLLRC